MSLIWFPHCSELFIVNVQASFASGETVQSVLALSQYLIKVTFYLISSGYLPSSPKHPKFDVDLGTPELNI